MSEELLPGLRRALQLCRLLDRRQAKDGLLREAVDCSDVIQREIRGIEYQRMLADNDNNPD